MSKLQSRYEEIMAMTVDGVRERVAAIRRHAIDEQDDEKAHIEEDNLHQDALWAASCKHPDAADIAAAALATTRMKFARWCA